MTALEHVMRQVRALEAAARARTAWCKGMKAVRRASPRKLPKRTKRTPRPLCHTSCSDLWRSFRSMTEKLKAAYEAASRAFRAGHLTTPFPPWTFRPPGHTISADPT